jgi:hypothetical protein
MVIPSTNVVYATDPNHVANESVWSTAPEATGRLAIGDRDDNPAVKRAPRMTADRNAGELWRRLGVQVDDSSSITLGVAAAGAPPGGCGSLWATRGIVLLAIFATPKPRGSAVCRNALACIRVQLTRRTMNFDRMTFMVIMITGRSVLAIF